MCTHGLSVTSIHYVSSSSGVLTKDGVCPKMNDSIITAIDGCNATTVTEVAASASTDAPAAGRTAAAGPAAAAAPLSEKESRLSYDRAMINCIREDGGTHTFFKSRPPVKGFTLCFKDQQVRTLSVLNDDKGGGVMKNLKMLRT